MNRPGLSLLLLVALAALTGWLLSHLNVIGRLGVNLLHTEYRFLTAWWKGALLVLGVWLALLAAHTTVRRRLPTKTARAFHAASALLALAGGGATYHDFRTNIAHRIIGERFHLGAYLFWLVWMLIALRSFVSVDKSKTQPGLHS